MSWVRFPSSPPPSAARSSPSRGASFGTVLRCSPPPSTVDERVDVTAGSVVDSGRQPAALLAPYVGFTFLAWYLNGLGAVLPPLRDDVGDWAGIYTLLPGAVLF